MSKALPRKMFADLKTSVLQPLLIAVQNDDTLHIEFHGDSLDICYRGGILYRVAEQGDSYTVRFNIKYCRSTPRLGNHDLLDAAIKIPIYKQKMDEYFRETPNFLQELQQSMVRFNNRSFRLSDATDYYILDTDFHRETSDSRTNDSRTPDVYLDMIALKWPYQVSGRDRNPSSLAVIDFKCGEQNLVRSRSLQERLSKTEDFLSDVQDTWDLFVNDMQKIFRQKCELGLIDYVDENNFYIKIPVDAKPEIIFAFAEHNPNKGKLCWELQEVKKMCEAEPERHPYPIRFAAASMMGYGLYERRMLSLDECLEVLKKDKPCMYSQEIYKLGETDYSVERWDVFGENIRVLKKPRMLGAIVGDVVGSVYERHNIKTTDFPLLTDKSFVTDDSVMTLAIAEALMDIFPARDGEWKDEYTDKLEAAVVKRMKELGQRYPAAGYGKRFKAWLNSAKPQPYQSWGNGSAMRVSPIAWAFDSLEDVEKAAEVVTRVTHDHPEGIKGAQATAVAIFLARTGESPVSIKNFIEERYGYNLERTIDEIRPVYTFSASCQKTVPEAITAFLEAVNFEDAIRLGISLGGDSDTLAAIAGSIAEGMWGIPDKIADQVFQKLPPFLQDILTRWDQWRKSEVIKG